MASTTKGSGVSGIGLGMASLGGFLIYIGIRNIPFVEGLREIASGTAPTPRPATPTQVEFSLPGTSGGGPGSGSGTANASYSGGTHPEIAREASKYIGVPYKWGGATTKGFDCSGLVQYVMRRTTGEKNIPRTTYTQVVWGKLKTVSRASVGAGDLVFWNGHVGIATNNKQMIHAPRPGKKVQIATINSSGPTGGPPTVCKRYAGAKNASV